MFPFQNSVSLKWSYLELAEDIQRNVTRVTSINLFPAILAGMIQTWNACIKSDSKHFEGDHS
jgi:hypothetical protein